MKCIAFQLSRLVVALATLAVVSPVTVPAGEPIQFSREKSRTAKPELKSRVPGNDRLDRLAPAVPGELFVPNRDTGRVQDPRELRRRKNTEREAKNWMIYDRGELQEKDDEEGLLGIRDYSIEKEDGIDEGLFGRKDDNDRATSRPKLPSSLSRLRGQNSNEPPPPRPGAADPGEVAARGKAESRSQGTQKRDFGGDQAAKEVPIRDLLRSDKTASTTLLRVSDAPGGDVDLDTSPAASRGDQRQKRDPVSATVFGSATTPSKSSGNGSTIGGNDPGGSTKSFASTTPSPPSSAGFNNPLSRNFSAGGLHPTQPGLGPNLGRVPNPYSINPPALSDPYYNRSATPGLGGPSAFPQQQQPNSAPKGSTFNTFSIPRR